MGNVHAGSYNRSSSGRRRGSCRRFFGGQVHGHSPVDVGSGMGYTARHMGLHSMDDPSSATASIVLASRKHSRLVEKVQGKGWYGPSSWGGRGKGKSKGDWTPTGDYKGEKGKGKKGKKGLQKGPNWDKKVNEWEKTKGDKPVA